MSEMTIKTGFYKVAQHGSGYVRATFFNPDTKESYEVTVRDDDDYRNDNAELYYMPIDETARIEWLHSNDQILVGDMVRVVKGRKVPIGTVGKVKAIKPFHDQYGRWHCDYIYFENGQRTNRANCVLA